MGLASWATLSRPFGTQFVSRVLTQGFKALNLYTDRSRGFENPLPRTKVRAYTK